MFPSAQQGIVERALEWFGFVMFVIALLFVLSSVFLPMNAYDEGLLLTNPHLILNGRLPYRDFYSNYAPGIFLLIAALWKIVGVSVLAVRGLGIALALAVALLAGRLAGRLTQRPFLWLAAAVVLRVEREFNAVPYAWLAALATALLACELGLRAGAAAHRRGPWVLAGVSFGLVSLFRHDLFVYLSATLGGGACVALARRQLRFDKATLTRAGALAIGVVAAVLVVWIPTFAFGGRQVMDDLYFDMVRHVMPARVLPIPDWWRLTDRPGVPVPLPSFLVHGTDMGFLLAAAVPVLAALVWLAGPSSVSSVRAPLGLASALAISVLPQMLGRTDMFHVLAALTPSLTVISATCARLAFATSSTGLAFPASSVLRRLPVLVISGGLLLQCRSWRDLKPAHWSGATAEACLPRACPIPDLQAGLRQKVLAFVGQHTRPGDPIYVGNDTHDRIIQNEVQWYFLTDRVGATRYLQFDPGTVTREDVQRQMIAELERARPRVAVLASGNWWREPNLSSLPGSSLLDRYLDSHYQVQGIEGHYKLLLRRPG